MVFNCKIIGENPFYNDLPLTKCEVAENYSINRHTLGTSALFISSKNVLYHWWKVLKIVRHTCHLLILNYVKFFFNAINIVWRNRNSIFLVDLDLMRKDVKSYLKICIINRHYTRIYSPNYLILPWFESLKSFPSNGNGAPVQN